LWGWQDVESVPKPDVPNWFDRGIVRDGERTLIHSACVICGFKIIGSVMDGLREREQHHLEHDHPTTQK
jgi:hypothetical protein